jgi:hypothetical protein
VDLSILFKMDRKALLESLWTRIKAALKNDEYAALFQESLKLEAEIISRCENALKHAIPGALIRPLEQLKDDSKTFKRRLEKWLGA